jgi:pilus assembly protein CpaB
MMQKQRIVLIIGLVLGVVVVFLIQVYLTQQRQIASEEARREVAKLKADQTAVLVAKEDIPKGALIKPELLMTKVLSSPETMPQAATSLDRIAGMVALVDIPKGQQITLNTLAFPRKLGSGGGLAEAIPPGKRAITINVDSSMSSLVGMIKPGDHVDIIATLPIPVQVTENKQVTQVASVPLFQDVLILAVGQETGAVRVTETQEGRYDKEQAVPQKKEISSLITLALTPQEASLIAFVQEQGKIRLVLRSPVDSQLQPLGPISWDALFQFLTPKDLASKQKPKEEVKSIPEPPPTGYVEIYRGLRKEKVPYAK